MPQRWLAVAAVTAPTSSGPAKAVALPEKVNSPNIWLRRCAGATRARCERLAACNGPTKTPMAIGVFVGPLQAASRSHLARVAPAHLRSQMFGLFTFSGKATAFAGPLLVGAVTAATASQRWGMSTIVAFFAVGFLLMLTVPTAKAGGVESD